MEHKNTETSTSPAAQRAIMENEILARGGEFTQDKVDKILAQASEIAVKQVSSEAADILVKATAEPETGVVTAEAEINAQDLAMLDELAARDNWDEDRINAVKASLTRR